MKTLERFYFPFFMSLFMSAAMSFVLTAIHFGLTKGLMLEWLYSWSIAFVIALPTTIFVAPAANRISNYLKDKRAFYNKPSDKSNL